MTRALFHFITRPGKGGEYATYVREHRLSEATLEKAGVEQWSVFVQADYVVVWLEAPDVEESIRLLSQNPEAQRFEQGEGEFLVLPESFVPMDEVVHYARPVLQSARGQHT